MIVLVAILLGALWGVRQARVQKGNRLDMAQYAAGYGIAAGLVTWIALIVIRAFLG